MVVKKIWGSLAEYRGTVRRLQIGTKWQNPKSMAMQMEGEMGYGLAIQSTSKNREMT